MTRTTIWTYPWDVLDIGAEEVLQEILDEMGLGGISLATSYHAGRFLQPRSPKRKVYFPEDGTIYFEPKMSRYRRSRIKPKVSSLVAEGSDVLRTLAEHRRRRNYTLNGWTVCLHNTRLGMERPEISTQNVFGDRNYYNLCPANPDSRAYITALVEDLTTSYHLDSIELESPNFMGFAHEFHHEKDGVGLTTEGDFLMSLCFCPHCCSQAEANGVAIEKARESVRRRIMKILESPLPMTLADGFVAKGLDNFDDDTDLAAFLRWRFEPVTDLCAAIRGSADAATAVYFLSLVTGAAWLQGIDVQAIGEVCDGLVVCAYDSSPAQVSSDIADARRLVPEAKYLSAGFRVFPGETSGPEELAKKVQRAVDSGAEGLNFYNYGLIPKARLQWIGSALAGIAAG